MMDIYERLNEGIEKILNEIPSLDVGSDEMNKATRNAEVLYKLRIEEEKLEIEKQRAETECSIQRNRCRLDGEKMKLDMIMNAAEIILPLTLYGVLSYIGFAREFDGVVTSDTLKRVIASIKKK